MDEKDRIIDDIRDYLYTRVSLAQHGYDMGGPVQTLIDIRDAVNGIEGIHTIPQKMQDHFAEIRARNS